ncbi:aldose 1-epimerase family protein [Pedobacter metabolipauper]|uniref:Galactose mutarotase-like enzyme n=1 Tax=Pedobacter metabolipauper TaxID=425513 RepID=A0A4R6SYK0_9SPHI|nr:aldose 1-epimerase family protein [Pedobacter metabolipauper]TDQ11137.1 galactose mutarotase-like enzyme [Pedobacter metabolipauper]
MINLENEYLKVSFASKGAELQSIKSKQNDKEYLWDGNPDFWAKHSPVLFPIVGGLKNNTYYFEDQKYQLSRHGFARDHEFQVTQVSTTEASFTFRHTPETLKIYPFKFSLKISYALKDNTLTCTYAVSNPDDTNGLLFSIGGHPAFALPATEQLKYSDYFLEFNTDDELVYHKIEGDLIDNETMTIKLTNKTLPLKHELFYEDALVFKNLKSNLISIKNTKNNHGLTFQFEQFPFFGIWAAKDADFVCLEPWCGIADGIDHNQDLKNKEGIIELAPGSEWQRKWSVVCF